MPESIEKLNVEPGEDGSRKMASWLRKDRHMATGLAEWTTTEPATLRIQLARVEERIPVYKDRPEEARTLLLAGLHRHGKQTAVVYECKHQPMDLRTVLTSVPKPSGDDRRELSRIIATQVRSLHVHFQLQHPGLRARSFVFFAPTTGSRPDLSRPYLLDWGRSASSDMYQQPGDEACRPLWTDHVWSLMMILSEIAEWRPLDATRRDEVMLERMKLERRKLVTSPEWKGAATADIFKFGFGIIDKDRAARKKLNKWEVKAFYDRLCESLAPSPPQ